MEENYDKAYWGSKKCPPVDCKKDACKCGLKKVFLPASLGDDSPNSPIAPKNGAYCNAIVVYDANDHVYIYSTEGVPTLINVEGGDAEKIIEELEKKLDKEILDRGAADDVLQQEIDDLKNSPDVVDIVATYAALQAYDTSKLGDNDIIRVLADETHDGQSTYYRWDKHNSVWIYIGAVGDYYTKDQTDALLAGKQNTLTAGSNITITGDTISATGTTYTAGANISISSENVISATDTTYTAGTGLSLNGTEFSADTSVLQEKLTAGNAIDITNNTISADIYPADFFTANATTTGTGTDITLNNTIQANLKSVELNGDTTQQTYVGKNLLPFPYNGTSVEHGVTFTFNDDGTVIVNGQSDGVGNSVRYFIDTPDSPLTLPAGTYYFIPPSDTSIHFTAYDGTSYYLFQPSNNWSYTFNSSVTIRRFYIEVSRGSTAILNNVKVYPMLSTLPNQTEADYEPYVGGVPAPNPDYPQTVNVVTGEQTVTISDGTNSQTCTVDLGSLELCKIGTYQDYIYKGPDGWYAHKTCDKVVLDGTEDWSYDSTSLGQFRVPLAGDYYLSNSDAILAYCDYYTTVAWNSISSYSYALTSFVANRLVFRNISISSLDGWKTWLGSHNMTVYYVASTSPTDTKITDSDLIAQLNELANATSYDDQTVISVAATSPNLPAILVVTAFRKSLDGTIGAINAYSNFNELTNRPKYNGVAMTGDTDIIDETITLDDSIDMETYGYVDAETGDAYIALWKLETGTYALAAGAEIGMLPAINETAPMYASSVPLVKVLNNGPGTDRYVTALTNDYPGFTVIVDEQGQFIEYLYPVGAFTGTDGNDDGTEGLVPAPTVSDAGKFLKSDGTWDTAGGGGPTVVQTTGTSQTDVMSQDATTKLIYPDIANSPYKQVIGEGSISGTNKGLAINGVLSSGINGGSIAIGVPDGSPAQIGQNGRASQSVAIGSSAGVGRGSQSVAIGYQAYANSGQNNGDNVAIGYNTYAGNGTATNTVALGANARATRDGEVNVGTGYNTTGYNSTAYRVIGGVHDGQDIHDAATVAQGNTLSASAPDSNTVGVLGQLWTDTTNMHTYQCTAISGSTYTWTQRW